MKTGELHAAMSKTWCAPRWAIMWEVGEATGGAAGRYADAVMMSLWPSMGLEVHGVETKVSRSDWKRELNDPRKAEAVGKFCDRWWIHTPPNIVLDEELPPAWGLRELMPDGKWRTRREAAKQKPEPVTRGFLAAMLRRADGVQQALIDEARREGHAAVDKMREAQRASFAKEVEAAAERRTRDMSDKLAKVQAFEAVFGPELLSSWHHQAPELARIAKALYLTGQVEAAERMSETLRAAATTIDKALAGVLHPKESES